MTQIEVNSENAQEVVNDLTMSVELADEDDQTDINFAVITEVIVNTSAIVAQTAAIPLQQQFNVCKPVIITVLYKLNIWTSTLVSV